MVSFQHFKEDVIPFLFGLYVSLMKSHSPSSWYSLMCNRSFSLTVFKITLPHLLLSYQIDCVRVRFSALRSVSLNQ